MKKNNHTAPLITIDGPSGSGKGTISVMLSKALGWHVLDSGAIYRAVAWAILHYRVALEDEHALQSLLKRIQIVIQDSMVRCDGHDITQAIREEACGIMASQSSALPTVRQAILQYQRDFRRSPGLIADGRDMGTVVFPDAPLKFYFNAKPEERALRRHKQLQEKGINVSLRDIQEDLVERDRRDVSRSASPAKPAEDAVVIDTTNLSIEEVFAVVMNHVKQRGLV